MQLPLSLDIHAYAPYPTANQKDGDADDRWYWLIWSLKRGQTWTSFDGVVTDPCDYIGSRLEVGFPLDERCTLLPMPSSSVTAPGAHWPAKRFADTVAARFGARVSPLLERTKAIAKASQASSTGASRPTVQQHIDSMEMAPPLPWEPLDRVVLVDDTLTRGTQLFAALQLLRGVGYTGRVRALCAGYTLKDALEVRATNVTVTAHWTPGASYAAR